MNRLTFPLLLAIPAAALILTEPRDASACGGCLSLPTENTQVASHRMVLSISQQQSTLYDQIKYSGNPSDMAWVLPIKGMVTVGLSSDALFNQLDQMTAVTVQGLGGCPSCNSAGFTGTEASSGTTGTGGVTVIAQQVVGPYETVQLSSSNPSALTDWLTQHGYAIPSDISPIISTYVNEGFDFLALRLVPGMGVDAMKPVRVTTPGASPVLPLRMVAAGAGTTVPITLFVLGEGRYDPTNFPTFTITSDQLVWDYDTSSSNYSTLRQQGFMNSGGKAWLIESANPQSAAYLTSAITSLATSDPADSGYADDMGNGAPAAAQADLDALLAGIDTSSLWITRMFAELPRAQLTTDLDLGASAMQTSLPTLLQCTKSIHDPVCSCGDGSSVGGAGGEGGAGGGGSDGGGCAIGGDDQGGIPIAGVIAALALAASRRKRTARGR